MFLIFQINNNINIILLKKMESKELSFFSKKYWVEKFLVIWSIICLFFSTLLPSENENYRNRNNNNNGNNGRGNGNFGGGNFKYMRFCSPGG